MVASFSKDGPQGREVISTRTSRLASSKVLTMLLRVSVRSGLVITSTSFKVVVAGAVGDKPNPRAVAASQSAAFTSGFASNWREWLHSDRPIAHPPPRDRYAIAPRARAHRSRPRSLARPTAHASRAPASPN